MAATKKHISFSEFRRVKEKEEYGSDEVRVSTHRLISAYVEYVISLLRGEKGKTQHDTVKICGMGKAIPRVVTVSEIVKRHVAGLHQITETDTELITTKYEKINDSTVIKEATFNVPKIIITLSTRELDTMNSGYQVPLTETKISEGFDFKDVPHRNGIRGARSNRGARTNRSGRARGRGSDKVSEKLL